MLLPILVLVCVVLFVVLLMPARKKAPDDALRQSLEAPVPLDFGPAVSMSFREQMLSEEAAEVSAAFRDAANKKWREEVIAKASTLLSAS